MTCRNERASIMELLFDQCCLFSMRTFAMSCAVSVLNEKTIIYKFKMRDSILSRLCTYTWGIKGFDTP